MADIGSRSYEISEPNYDVPCPHCGINGQKMGVCGRHEVICGECFKEFKIEYVRYRIEHKTIKTRID